MLGRRQKVAVYSVTSGLTLLGPGWTAAANTGPYSARAGTQVTTAS